MIFDNAKIFYYVIDDQDENNDGIEQHVDGDIAHDRNAAARAHNRLTLNENNGIITHSEN